ncbi:MAG TPA: hypothetical protein H9672_11295 [Firmicutes bacterium]|nr:hypothetical protein [Bacillota bacterium]
MKRTDRRKENRQKKEKRILPDFLKYNGCYYLYEEKECRKIDVSEDLGETHRLAGLRRGRIPRDFEASRLKAGTRIYRIYGVLDDSQLAAHSQETYKVYEMVSREAFYESLYGSGPADRDGRRRIVFSVK